MSKGFYGILEKEIPIRIFFKRIGLSASFLYVLMLVFASVSSTFTNILKVLFLVMLFSSAAYAVLKRRKLTFNPVILAIIAFALFVLLTCVWAENKTVAFTEATRLIELLLMSLSLYLLIDNEDDVRLIINALLIGGLYMICSALWTYGLAHTIQTIKEGGRVALQQANLFSALLNLTNAIMLFYLFFEKKYWYAVPIAVSMILLLGTASRTGFIVTCVQILVFILIKTRRDGMKFAIPALAVLIAAVLLVLPRFIDMTQYGERIESIGDFMTEDSEELSKADTKDGSLVKRKIMIEFGNRLIKKKPVQGFGLGHYEYYFSIEYNEVRPPHSTYIQLMVGTGLIGTVCYYSVYAISGTAFAILSFRKKKKGEEKPAAAESGKLRKWGKAIHEPGGYSPLFLCIIIMYLVSNLSTNMLMNKYPYVFFGLVAAYFGMVKNDIGKGKKTNNKKPLKFMA